jgi:hypothetical protein
MALEFPSWTRRKAGQACRFPRDLINFMPFSRKYDCLELLIVLYLLFPIHLYAQAPEPAPAPVDPAEAGGAEDAPIRIGPVTLSGSAWAESVIITGDEGDESAGMFRIRRARIGLAGNIAPRIGWNISGEFTAEPMLRNAFLLIRFADQLNVRIGQATPPSGLERGTGVLSIELIDRSRVTSQFTSGLDAGMTIMNAEPYKGWVGYAFSVFNGVGYNRSDNNDAKDLAARMVITPPPLRGFTVVASGGTGRQPDGRRNRSGLGVEYDVARFKVAVEGLRQTHEGQPNGKGGYIVGVYRIHPAEVTPHFRMLELAARYFVLHDPASANGGQTVPDEDGGGQPSGAIPSTVREFQGGLNYYVNRNVRFMADVVVPKDRREESATTFLTRLQIVF